MRDVIEYPGFRRKVSLTTVLACGLMLLVSTAYAGSGRRGII